MYYIILGICIIPNYGQTDGHNVVIRCLNLCLELANIPTQCGLYNKSGNIFDLNFLCKRIIPTRSLGAAKTLNLL